MAAYDFNAPRLFVDEPLISDAEIPVVGDRANRLLNVLRLRDGATVLLFNGRDGEWRATMAQTSRRAATLRVEECVRAQTTGPDIDYCFAPLKHARLDYVVQKAVEMGVRRVRPVLTRRTQVARINIERMEANVIEAAEQCGVIAVPRVLPAIALDALLQEWETNRSLILCDEDAPIADPLAALRAASASATTHGLLIGPEGGFAPDERDALLAHLSVVRLSLGPRILRADTAAVAALALIQAVHGDWRALA